MLNILTYVLIALAAISAASFQIMTMFNNNSMLINSQSEQLSLGKIVANIEDSMTSDPISGDYRVLLGENPSFDNDSDGLNDIPYHTIPSGLGIPKINAWGKYYVYCPIGDEISGRSLSTNKVNSGTKEGDNSNYTAKTFSFNDQEFVAESDQVIDSSIPSNVRGLVISPYSKDGITPSCSDVTYDGENYLARNAMVKAIIPGYSSSPLVENINLHSGTNNVNDYNSLIQNTDAIKINIDFAAKDYTMDATLDLCFDNSSTKKQVFLNGSYDSDASAITTIDASGTQKVDICNAEVFIEDIIFKDTLVKTDNSKITIQDSTMNELSMNESKASLSGTVNFNQHSSLSVIDAVSSDLILNGVASTVKVLSSGQNIIDLVNSSFYASNSSVVVEYSTSSVFPVPSTVRVDDSSEFTMNKGSFVSRLENNSEAIMNYSDVSFSGVSVSISRDSGFVGLYDGATLKLDGSNVNVKNGGYAIRDVSGLGVFGNNSNISSSFCWEGNLFKDTLSQTTGSSKSATGAIITNRSDWDCN